MIAKLIVWDVDRVASTRRMIRALHEYTIGGLKTLIPFHLALLETDQWRAGETCRDLVEDKKWLKELAFDKPPASGETEGEEEPKVERSYAVEVSGKRFDVKVIGAAIGGNGAAAAAGAGAKAAKRPALSRVGGGVGATPAEAARALEVGRRRRARRARVADPGHGAQG